MTDPGGRTWVCCVASVEAVAVTSEVDALLLDSGDQRLDPAELAAFFREVGRFCTRTA